jgi:hypothetical protein
MRTKLLFEAFPYVAAAMFAAGVLGRAVLARRDGPCSGDRARDAPRETARIGPTLAAILAALHAIVLALPAQVLAWNADPARLYGLEGAGLVAGVGAVVAWSLGLPGTWRTARPRRASWWTPFSCR